MCAIKTEGLLGYELIDDAYKSTKFLLFIQTKLLRYEYLIMDNVRYYKVAEVIQLIQSTGCGINFYFLTYPNLMQLRNF